MTMDRGINQVRVRGAGVPMNVPREAPEPPTNPYSRTLVNGQISRLSRRLAGTRFGN